MPTTRQRAKGMSRQDIDRELAAAIAEETMSTKAQAEARKRRERIEEQKRELEEAEKIRRIAERDLHMSTRDERLRKDAYADLAWERMGEVGRCYECEKREIDCYRASIDPDDRLSPSVKVFRIGKLSYSTCQECKVHRRGCELIEARPPAALKRKHEAITPPHDVDHNEVPREEKRRKPLNSDHRSTALPTPSPEFLEGTSTRPLVPRAATQSAGQCMDRFGRKLKTMEGSFTTVNSRLGEMDRRFDGMSKQIDAQKDILATIAGYMRNWGADVGQPASSKSDDVEEELEYTDEE